MMMVGFGAWGWVLRKLEVPLVPVILGILLGNEIEVNLRRAMTIANGDGTVLFGSWLALTLWAIAIVDFIVPMIMGQRLKLKMKQVEEKVAGNGD